MLKRLLLAAILATAGACYEDDSVGPTSQRPFARVLLTDAPFPYDSVTSVNVHIVSIEANASPDTSGGGEWVLLAAPDRAFDLLQLQRGETAVLGEGELDAAQYQALRMIVDADRSSVLWSGGIPADVSWPYPGFGQIRLYSLVEAPLEVAGEDADIVIDFDVGRSFLYNLFGNRRFLVLPWLRAVNTAVTGTITGTVTAAAAGLSGPLSNANITVYKGNPAAAENTWYVVATGRTDAQGVYRIAFVREGQYNVKLEHPLYPILAPTVVSGVTVARGEETTVSAALGGVGGGGSPYVGVSGPTAVGVGGSIALHAVVLDENGDPVTDPVVNWSSSDPTRASVTSGDDTAIVMGLGAGWVRITAESGGEVGWRDIEVIGDLEPVASVQVSPLSATLSVGDSTGFIAELRDAAGHVVTGRPVTWFSTNTPVASIEGAFGASVVVRAHTVGGATIRATSEGHVGEASVTVQ